MDIDDGRNTTKSLNELFDKVIYGTKAAFECGKSGHKSVMSRFLVNNKSCVFHFQFQFQTFKSL